MRRRQTFFLVFPLQCGKGKVANVSYFAKAVNHAALLDIYTVFYMQMFNEVACVTSFPRSDSFAYVPFNCILIQS